MKFVKKTFLGLFITVVGIASLFGCGPAQSTSDFYMIGGYALTPGDEFIARNGEQTMNTVDRIEAKLAVIERKIDKLIELKEKRKSIQ